MGSDHEIETTALLQRGYRYALALTHDRSAAEELLHDAWASVLASREDASAPSLLRALRHRWTLAPPDTDPALPVQDEIGQALGSLPALEREVLYLHAVEGWSADEIGALTERPRTTVLTILARARQRIGSWREAQRKLEAP
jgi:DNA-directed RNA polymerase specialized sigma24 family protein